MLTTFANIVWIIKKIGQNFRTFCISIKKFEKVFKILEENFEKSVEFKHSKFFINLENILKNSTNSGKISRIFKENLNLKESFNFQKFENF